VTSSLHLVIRTPHETVMERAVDSVRVPTETGQVGLRAREEHLMLVVEPGLVVARSEDGLSFAATAGGLLHLDGDVCALYTPFAVLGSDGAQVLESLERALRTPDSELAARRQLGDLERRIAQELRERSPLARARPQHD
jgi:F0F1-type ATP synthase epsilon subunit